MKGLAAGSLAAFLLALGLAAGWAIPGPALAHAVLEAAQPGDGAVVAQSPSEVTLRFNEHISPVFARVLGADGKPLTAPADVSAEDNRITIRLTHALTAGSYMVSYRVVSADTHVVGAAFPFVVGKAGNSGGANAVAAASASHEDVWDTLIIVDRAVELAALLIASGGALFILLMLPAPEVRKALFPLATYCAIAGIVAALLAIGLQGGLMADAPPSDLLSGAPWQMGGDSTRATSALFAVPGLVVLWMGIGAKRSKSGTALLLTSLAAVAASLVVAGHGATVEPRWVALPAWIVHVVVAAFWIGSLPPLLFALKPGPAVSQENVATRSPLEALARFSRLALPAVGLLIIAGGSMAALQIGAPAALTQGGAYVTLLFVKLLLVIALLALAARNRYVLMPRLARTHDKEGAKVQVDALRRTIKVELAIGLAVIAVAAALAQQRAPVAQPIRTPIEQTLDDGHGHRAALQIRFETDGTVHMAARFAKPDGSVLKPVDVSLELSNPGAGVEPLVRRMEPAGDEYGYSGRDLVVAGSWSVRIEADITDFDQGVFTTQIAVRR
jgi:copper transport protein